MNTIQYLSDLYNKTHVIKTDKLKSIIQRKLRMRRFMDTLSLHRSMTNDGLDCFRECCNCCPNCGELLNLVNDEEQILRIVNSTCDASCQEGSFNQIIESEFTGGPIWGWSLLPRVYTVGFGIPSPDNCLYCEFTNQFGFTIQYTTGMQFSLSCITAGENAGKWSFTVETYRRGDEPRDNCDEAASGSLTNLQYILNSLSVNDEGYIVGGPFTITLPEIDWPNSSGDGDPHHASECTFDVMFGPEE